MTPVTLADTRKGSMPISRSRKSALTASVACIEDRTRWPVIDAWTAISRGLPVAHLADQDHVGVLAQDRPQPEGEGEPGGRVDLGLVDVLERVLDRVLDGRHVERGTVELVDRRVERGRLAAAGGSGHDDHPVARPEQPLVDGLDVGGDAELGQAQDRPVAVEQAHDDLLAPDRAHRGDPDVDRTAVDVEGDLAVLGALLLDDVELGEDLDPAHEARRQVRGEFARPRGGCRRRGHGSAGPSRAARGAGRWPGPGGPGPRAG